MKFDTWHSSFAQVFQVYVGADRDESYLVREVWSYAFTIAELIIHKKYKVSQQILILTIVTAQPQPQPNSTSSRVGVDKVISRTTHTTPPTTPKLLSNFQTT